MRATAPFTLASYSVNGKADKECRETKKMMYNDPGLLHQLLGHLAEAIGEYACYQVGPGLATPIVSLLVVPLDMDSYTMS